MANLILVGESTVPNPLSAYLREMLPDDFVVVSDPVVRQSQLDAVVVGPGGLILIAAADDQAADAYPLIDDPPAAGLSHEQVVTSAMRAFLADTFPAFWLPIRYVAATCDSAADLPGWTTIQSQDAQPENLALAVARIQAAGGDILKTQEAREEVGVALRDRRLTADQRAARPFVFRGSGPFGVTANAWSIREIVNHIDRRPGDGIYHLANGTLAHWLEEQGAADLARLARSAVDAGRSNRRRALETFLLGTGLVERPHLVTQPKLLDLGYAISGETLMGRLRLRRGRGRGYLFGTLEPNAPWLEVQPRSFAGEPLDLAVTVDTLSLMINPAPYEAAVLLASSASAEPIAVPVRVHVVRAPAPVNRYLHRPLAALVLGLLPAALIGLLWGLAAPPLPAAVTAALGLPSPVAWAAAVMALWGIMGLIRGFAQPSAWPVLYAARRWLLYLAIAAPLMAVLGMAAAWWWQLSFGTSPGAPGVLMMRAALVGLALATLPATLASLRRWPEPVILKPKSALPMPSIDDDRTAYGERWPWLRQHARGAAWGSLGFIVLAMILVFVPQLARLDWQEVRSRQQLTGAQTWVETQWLQLNVGANRLVDRLYLSYYDHRAPLVPSPEPPAGQWPTPAASGGQ